MIVVWEGYVTEGKTLSTRSAWAPSRAISRRFGAGHPSSR